MSTDPQDPPAASGPPRWRDRGARRLRQSPFLPAVVLAFILAAVAGLFAGSYTYALADPTPRRVPTAVVGLDPPPSAGGAGFLDGMEAALDSSLDFRPYADYARARLAVEEQRAFAVLRRHGDGIALDVAGASGASVAELLSDTAERVSARTGVPVRVRDVKPLQRGDPRGLALFYVTIAAVITGFVGAIQLSQHARTLNPAERIAATGGYALLGGLAIAGTVDWWLGAVDLPFAESWLILTLTMFASGMVFTMFNTLIGRWAVLPTWGLMVVLGNPSSGGAVSWPLLPSALGYVGRLLPPGASVNAQHTAVYFAHHQQAWPFLVLGAWGLGSSAVFWVWRHRHPGGRPSGTTAA